MGKKKSLLAEFPPLNAQAKTQVSVAYLSNAVLKSLTIRVAGGGGGPHVERPSANQLAFWTNNLHEDMLTCF
jgi:hypothetical protein